MEIRKYWTNKFNQELGELDRDDKEVLEDTISFMEASENIRRLF